MAYSFRVTDRRTQQVTYVDDVDGMRNLIDTGVDGAIEVVDADGSVLRVGDGMVSGNEMVAPDNPRELADTFTQAIWSVPVGKLGDDAEFAYTRGDCDVFAVALGRLIPDGQVVGIVDPFDENGEIILGAPPHLVHAGLYVDDYVIDVRGIHDRHEWEAKWAEKGSADCEFEFLDQEQLEGMQGGSMDEDQIQEAMRIARLVAVANGYEVEPEHAPALAA